MKRNLLLLIPVLICLASCGTASQFAQQKFQDGVYSQPVDEPQPVHILSKSEIEQNAKAELDRQKMLKDTVFVYVEDSWVSPFFYRNWWFGGRYGFYAPWSYRHSWFYDPFFPGPWFHDPWFYDSWYYGSWFYDSWYLDPWYYPGYHYGGFYPGFHPGGSHFYDRNAVYTPRRNVQPLRSQYGHFSDGSNYRYSSGGYGSGGSVRTRSGSSDFRVAPGVPASSSVSRGTQNGNIRYNFQRSYGNNSSSGSSQRSSSYERSAQSQSFQSRSSSSGSSRSSYSGGSGSFGGGSGSYGSGNSSHSGGGGGGGSRGGGRR